MLSDPSSVFVPSSGLYSVDETGLTTIENEISASKNGVV